MFFRFFFQTFCEVSDEPHNVENCKRDHSAGKILTVPEKRGKSQSVEKSKKGDPSALEWLFISC